MDLKIEKLFALLPGNIFWKDIEGRYLGCNQNVANFLKLDSPQDIIGKTNADFFSPEIVEMVAKTDEVVIKTKKEIQIEEEAVNDKGEPATYITRKLPLLDDENNVIGILGIGLDITERKHHERQLAMDKEKGELAQHLKPEFLMNISHDIRTPLNGILGFTELLLENEADPYKKECLGYITQSAKRLSSFLTEAIDSAQQSLVNDRHHSLCELEEIINNNVQMIRAEVARKGIDVEVSIDPTLPKQFLSDPIRIDRILLNLLSNAVKFTDSGKISISANLLEQTQDGLTFGLNVQDTGKGIDQKHHSAIFDQFTTLSASSSSNSQKGYGLGLYMVKNFCDELNADIRVDSTLGNGALFQLVVPAKTI